MTDPDAQLCFIDCGKDAPECMCRRLMERKKPDGYWTVTMRVFAFDTEAQADEFHARLIDAFTSMPEAEEYAASSGVEFEADDDRT